MIRRSRCAEYLAIVNGESCVIPLIKTRWEYHMQAGIVQQLNRNCVTVAVADGHEFEFEVSRSSKVDPARLFAERWKHRRLPLNAAVYRQAARAVAEARFRDQGLI